MMIMTTTSTSIPECVAHGRPARYKFVTEILTWQTFQLSNLEVERITARFRGLDMVCVRV